MGSMVKDHALACYAAVHLINRGLAAEIRDVEEDLKICGPLAERELEPERTKRR